MSKLIIAAVVEKIETRADKTLKVVLATQEIDSSEAATLFGFKGEYCKVLLSTTNIEKAQELAVDQAQVKDSREIKSKAQRLRNTLYRVWEITPGAPDDFDDYYNNKMEELITHFKAKLP